MTMNKGNICISVCAETAEKLIGQIKQAEELADVIEIRFDGLDKTEHERLWSKLKDFRKRYKGKLLATFRSFEQGGKRNLTFAEREEFWVHSHVFEFVDWADLELDFPVEKINKFWGEAFEKVIKSFHDFEKIPVNLNKIFDEISDSSELIKIAVSPTDVTESITIWKLLTESKSEHKKFIPIAMGEAGKWTRILGLAHGAFMTYASLDSGNETAPGQVSASDLIEVYRAKELDENTEVYGIIGNPVSHSVSPEMQNAAFKFHNLNAVYIPFEVKDLDSFITRMVIAKTREIDLNIKGFSVTIPHKQSIIKHLDFVDKTAKAIGAVNTVKLIDDKLYGYNTDAQGFIEPLKMAYGDLKDVNIVILGAGGSARACVYALKNEGADVTILARDQQKAKDLADDFNVKFAGLYNDESNLILAKTDILVNSTPIGMKGELEGKTPVVAEQIKDVKLVYDLVFNPFQTQLMKEADKVNVPKIGGMAMLVAQGAAQQKIWTGKEAPLKEMSQAVLRKLQK